MLIVGASRTWAFFARHSSPISVPRRWSSSGFQVEARAEPQGRHTLGVELKKRLPRTASAPSVMQREGIDRRGMARVRQNEPPGWWLVLGQ